METTELIERTFTDIKDELDRHVRNLRMFLEDTQPQDYIKPEWQRRLASNQFLVNHELGAMREWLGRRNVDPKKLALI
jgi:hypothetical protein